MGWTRVFLCAVFFSFSLAQVATADEASELKREIETTHKEIKELKEKVEKLEAGDMGGKPGPANGVAPLEFKMGIKVEFEFVDTQNDSSTGEPKPHFQLDKVALEPHVRITEDIRFEGELELGENSLNAKTYYFTFQNLPHGASLQVGKSKRIFKPNRKTERYPLAGGAFWRDHESGIVLKAAKGPLYGALSLSQGLELNLKDPNEDNSINNAYDMLHDNSRKSNYNGIKELGAWVGYKRSLGGYGTIDLLLWGLYNKLSGDDITFLKDNLNNYSSNDDDQHRVGLNLDYTLKNLNIFVQYVAARDGELNRYAWYVQPSYKGRLPFGWKYANEYLLLARYDWYGVDNVVSFDKPATWDREAVTIAFHTYITKKLILKTEYTFNGEKTGNGSVDNNELVLNLSFRI